MTLDPKIGVGLLVVVAAAVFVGARASYEANGSRVTFGKFVSCGSPEFAEADVLVDGNKVGVITRCKNDDFVSESSRTRKWVVTEYEVVLYQRDDDDSGTFVVGQDSAAEALSKAKDYCRRKLETS